MTRIRVFALAVLICTLFSPFSAAAVKVKASLALAQAPVVNIAIGKPVTVTTNGVNENHDCAGLSAADITDGSLEYKPSSWCTEDGVVGYVNDNYNELMRITITIDLQGLYRVSRIRYNMGNVQRAETWNADTMITPFGSTGTTPGSSYSGAWTEHSGDASMSSVTVVLEKTRVSYETDWLFVGEIEVYGETTSHAITIDGVEVTQAIQCTNTGECFGPAHSSWCPSGDCTNAVPLLLNKPTWARVYVQGQPDGLRVKASLAGYAQNGDPLPGSPIFSPTNVIAHPDGGDRGKPGDSFNFRLPVEWTLYDNITLQARVYLAAGGPSIDSRELWLAFTERNHMPIYSWRFRFPNVAAATQAETWAAARFTAQVYPINDNMIDLRDQGELETKARTWQGLAAELAKPCADALRKSGYPAARCYGWVPKGVTMQSSDGRTYYGWTDYGVSVGYVYRPPLAGSAQNLAPQYIMAHEIGHTFAPLNHVATARCGGSAGGQFESQFPNTTGSIGQYGFYDAGTARVYVPTVALPDHPVNYFDFMSYCGVDANRQWVSPYTYRHLYDALGDPYLAHVASAPVTDVGPYLIASGVITPSGLISLNHFYQEQYPAGSYDTAGTGAYRLEIQDARGNLLFTRYFDQKAPEWLDAGAPVYFFEIMPLAPGATKVVIKQGAVTLGQVSASPNPPQVTLTEPQPGVISGDTLQMRWTGSDLDGDQVKYMIEYSADAGRSWQTLALNWAGASLMVKTSDLPGSDQAKVRVLASDGLNTTVAESGLLLVPTKVPRVTIISPEEGSVLAPGQPINLSGIAEDREDGTLNGPALTWTLDGDATVGTGRQLTLFNPPAGRHTITLTARDRNGNAASTNVSVFVGYQSFLPLTLRGR